MPLLNHDRLVVHPGIRQRSLPSYPRSRPGSQLRYHSLDIPASRRLLLKLNPRPTSLRGSQSLPHPILRHPDLPTFHKRPTLRPLTPVHLLPVPFRRALQAVCPPCRVPQRHLRPSTFHRWCSLHPTASVRLLRPARSLTPGRVHIRGVRPPRWRLPRHWRS